VDRHGLAGPQGLRGGPLTRSVIPVYVRVGFGEWVAINTSVWTGAVLLHPYYDAQTARVSRDCLQCRRGFNCFHHERVVGAVKT
jgi:hypothetical protein